MSQFEHESPDQSTSANKLARELAPKLAVMREQEEEREFWKAAACAALNVLVTRNGTPEGMYAQDFAYSAALHRRRARSRVPQEVPCMSGKMPPEPAVPYPDCMLCGDTGLQHLPDYPPCYRWCVCRAGIARRAAEPNLVDESNARELALGIVAKR